MEKSLKLFVLTDGEEVFLKKRMTLDECEEKNVKAREATDGNLWWAPAVIDDVPPASRREAVEKGLVSENSISETSGPEKAPEKAHEKTDREKLERARQIEIALTQNEGLAPKNKMSPEKIKALESELNELVLEVGYILEAAGKLQNIAGNLGGYPLARSGAIDALLLTAGDLERGRIDLKGALETVEAWISKAGEFGRPEKDIIEGAFGCAKNVLTAYIHAV